MSHPLIMRLIVQQVWANVLHRPGKRSPAAFMFVKRSRIDSAASDLGVARARPCPAPDSTGMSQMGPPAVFASSVVHSVVRRTRAETCSLIPIAFYSCFCKSRPIWSKKFWASLEASIRGSQ